MFIASELYEHNISLLNKYFCLSTNALSSIYTILQLLAVLFLIFFIIEFIMYKLNIKIISINCNNIFYKILFYVGCAISSFGIVALITFYTLITYSK